MSIALPSFIETYLTPEEITKLQKKKKALHTEEYKHLMLVRLSHDYRGYPRGTVFHEHGIITGYPRILRVLHLENGIKRYCKGSFFVEEKVDGYNARIALIKGNAIAVTRGGFICPFTTRRIADMIDLNFFDLNPGYVICGEVVGPGSPYNTEAIPYIEKDVVFFAFDLMDESGRKLSSEERHRVLEPFNIQQVRRWGPFSTSDMDAIKSVILELERDGREGVVIKPLLDKKPIKYVTLSSCLRDLQAACGLMAEIPAGFYIQRILRAIFFCHEFDISLSEDYLLESARALYLLPQRVVEAVAEGENVREKFKVNVREKDAIYGLLEHLTRSGLSTKLISLEKTNDYYSAKFHRIYSKATREIRQRLMGHGFFD
ncbi:MAG: RNA ligase [Nitrospira sp.]|nr:RNA ligase [Nitrospira sp.]